MYLAVDGGGTKLVCLLFDEDLHLIRTGRSGGVNTTQNAPDQVLAHVRDCLDQVFPEEGIVLEEAFVIFVGDRKLFEQELRRRALVQKLTFLGESEAGLLAGAGRKEGLLAISGTGSDVFLLSSEGKHIVGGWGIVLGDQGSGPWIGLKAIRTVIRTLDGWHQAESDILQKKVLAFFDAEKEPRKIVGAVHGAPAPFPIIASLVPVVAEAAREGDPYALSLFEDAGRVLARQMLALIRRTGTTEREITVCGGVFKSHPAVFDTFRRTILAVHPDMEIHRPWFEHVLAGPMEYLLQKGFTPEEARRKLAQAFPDLTMEEV